MRIWMKKIGWKNSDLAKCWVPSRNAANAASVGLAVGVSLTLMTIPGMAAESASPVALGVELSAGASAQVGAIQMLFFILIMACAPAVILVATSVARILLGLMGLRRSTRQPKRENRLFELAPRRSLNGPRTLPAPSREPSVPYAIYGGSRIPR